MEHALRFLDAILPPTGLRVIASKPPGWTKGFKHTFLETNEATAAEAERLDKLGVTNYIALAGYNSPDGGRMASNTVALQCLWLDVDYKNYPDMEAARVDGFQRYESPEEAAENEYKRYGSKTLAEADVARLAEVLGTPSLQVMSGGGSHTYWVLRETLPTAQWQRVANAFQGTWQGMGIKADPISADAARVLRIPGTHNFKEEYGEPREVVLTFMHDLTYSVVTLLPKFTKGGAAPKKRTHNIPAMSGDIPDALRDPNDDLAGGIERRPSFFPLVLQKCKQMGSNFLGQKTLSEPVWYASVQLTRHLDDGKRASHAMSQQHPGYSETATDDKLAQLEANDIGPTTCAKFKQVNPGGCSGCQYNITSPIILGYKEVENVEPVVTVIEHTVTDEGEAITVERVERPNVTMPFGYKYNGTAIFRRVKEEEDGPEKDVEIFRGFLCPERIVTNERNNHQTEIQLYVHSEGQAPKHITIPGKVLAEKKDLARELLNRGVLIMSKGAPHILDLLQRMTQETQSRKRDAKVAEQMGWQEDGMFVVGATGYRHLESPHFDLPVPTSTKGVADKYAPFGSLVGWKKTVNVYNHKGAEAYQFAVCYGAAGVFLPMTQLSGAVLSLYSQAAGRGKSTAGEAALSWWGNPDTLKSQSKDTNNALFNKASRHKNLPILMDEVTDKPSHELEDLVYFMTQGREKESLTSERTARPILPGWALPIISTSNNSIKSKLQAKRGDAQGLFARIIEVPMDLPFAINLGYEDRMLLKRGFKENYGHAGPKMVEFAMNNRDAMSSMLDKFAMTLDKAVNGDSAYRFWVASCAAALTAAVAAKTMGLIDYDIKALTQWTIDTLRSQRQDAVTAIATSDDVLAQFLEVNANRMLVSYQRTIGAGASAPAVWPEEGVHGTQLVGRAELTDRSLYVSVPAFQRFCHDSGFDLGAFIRNAAVSVDTRTGERLLKSSLPVYTNLGKGTKTVSARTKTLQFNLLHPTLAEFAAGIDSKIEFTHMKVVK